MTLLCKYCDSPKLQMFLDYGNLPIPDGHLSKKRYEQLKKGEFVEKKYPLQLFFCENCGVTQLGFDVPPEEMYREYNYFTSISDWAKQYTLELAEHLKQKCKLPEDAFVVEVASNDGCYIKSFKRYGYKVLGVEPALNVAKVAEEAGVPTFTEFFNEQTSGIIKNKYGQADLILCMNVFPHVPDPNNFTRGLKNLLKKNGTIVVHSHYFKELLKTMAFDTVYHEHYTYISLRPVQYICNKHGLEVYDIDFHPIYCGSARYYIGYKGEHPVSSSVQKVIDEEIAAGMDKKEVYLEFGKKVHQVKYKLMTLLSELRKQGKTIVGYGAAAKASTLLNYCGIGTGQLSYIVDKSPYKQGLYTPGGHIPVYAPEKLIEDMPDYLLILVWNFGTEVIQQQSQYYKKGGKFIIPLPQPMIITIDETKKEQEILPGLKIRGKIETF